MGLIFFPAYDWAISPTHPEREERLLYTQDQLREEGIFDIDGLVEYKPDIATEEDVMRSHFCFPDVETRDHGIAHDLRRGRDQGGAHRDGRAGGQVLRPGAASRAPRHEVGPRQPRLLQHQQRSDHDRVHPGQLRREEGRGRGHRLPPRRRLAGHLLERPGRALHLHTPGRADPVPGLRPRGRAGRAQRRREDHQHPPAAGDLATRASSTPSTRWCSRS